MKSRPRRHNLFMLVLLVDPPVTQRNEVRANRRPEAQVLLL